MSEVLEERNVIKRKNEWKKKIVEVEERNIVKRMDIEIKREKEIENINEERRNIIEEMKIIEIVNEEWLEKIIGVVVMDEKRLKLKMKILILKGKMKKMRKRILGNKIEGDSSEIIEEIRKGRRKIEIDNVGEKEIEVEVKNRMLVVKVFGKKIDLIEIDRNGELVILKEVEIEKKKLKKSKIG